MWENSLDWLLAVSWRFPSFSCLQPVHLCQVRLAAYYKGLHSRSNNHTKPLQNKTNEGLSSKSFIRIFPSRSVLCGYDQFQFLIFTPSQSEAKLGQFWTKLGQFWTILDKLSTYRVIFFTGTPPKISKYRKVNLG